MERSNGDHPSIYCFMVRIFLAAPGYSSAGYPVIFPSARVNLLNNRILETTPAQAGNLYAFDGMKRAIGNIDIQNGFRRKPARDHKRDHSFGIEGARLKAKPLIPFLGNRDGRETQNRALHSGGHGARVHDIVAKIDPLIDARHQDRRRA